MTPKSLSKFITQTYGFESDSRSFRILYRASIQYILRAISSSELQAKVTDLTGDKSREFRLTLTNSGYYTLNLKMHVIKSVAYGNHSKVDKIVADSIQEHSILKRDRKALATLNLYSDPVVREKVKAIKSEFKGRRFIPSMRTIQNKFAWVLAKIKPHINRAVYMKLRFVAKANNLELSDLQTDLVAKLLQTYYWMMPQFKSVNYMIASLTQSINNHVVNTIGFWTAKKRARMVQTETGGFALTEVSSEIKVGDEVLNLGDLMSTDTSHKDIVLRLALRQLVDKFAHTKKRSKILSLMIGVYDPEFTEYLVSNGHLSYGKDNTDWAESASRINLIKVIAKYVDVKRKFVRYFLGELKTNMGYGEVQYA